MNSPKTSAQASAPVAAIRSVLPTDANERVEAALNATVAAENAVDALAQEAMKLDRGMWHYYVMNADSFANRSHAEREKLRAAVRGRLPGLMRLRLGIAQLPTATARRLSDRLDEIVEEASEVSADSMENIEDSTAAFPDFDSVDECLRHVGDLPASTRSVNMNNCLIIKFGAENAALIMRSLPRDVRHLSMAICGLSYFGADGVARIFGAFPPGLKSVDLSGNALASLGAAGIAQVLAALPSGMRCVNMRNDDFAPLRASGLKMALAALPKNIVSLGLGGESGLDGLPPAGLANAIAALPPSIRFVDFVMGSLAGSAHAKVLESACPGIDFLF